VTRRLIFMNEAIREPRPSKPVIVVQTGKRQRASNRWKLKVAGVVVAEVRFLKGGLKDVKTHRVRAFIEVFDGVEVVA
jgi:hypothetical protein